MDLRLSRERQARLDLVEVGSKSLYCRANNAFFEAGI